jgi:integrase
MKKQLTAAFVKGLKPGPKKQVITDSVAANLRLIVHPTGRKIWAWQGKVNGEPKTVTLGQWLETGGMDLSAARERATEINTAKVEGRAVSFLTPSEESSEPAIDPRASLTCDWMFDQYMAAEGETRKTAKEKRTTYNREIKPTLGERQIDTITYDDLAAIVQKKFAEGKGPASNRLKALIARWWKWGVSRGRAVTGLTVNPAIDLVSLADENKRRRYLTNYEIGVFFKGTYLARDTFAEMMTVILYTGLRRSEAAGLTWDEVRFHDNTILISGERIKNGLDLLLWMPDTVVAILRQRKRLTGNYKYVWPAPFSWRQGETVDEDEDTSKELISFTKPMNALNETCQKLAAKERKTMERFTVHDLRRTLATGMRGLRDAEDKPLILSDIVERVINHIIGGVRGNYDHHDYFAEKKAALRIWAEHLDPIRLTAHAAIEKTHSAASGSPARSLAEA